MYTAQQLLIKVVKRMSVTDIYKMIELTLINSWWGNTDGYVMIVKRWLKLNPDYIK